MRSGAAALAAAACLGAAGAAPAHDAVEGTTPARGAVLRSLPATVSMDLALPVGRIDGIHVTRNGAGDFARAARIDPRDGSRVVATLRRPGPRFRAGRWRVAWRVVGADGHRQTFTARFRVR